MQPLLSKDGSAHVTDEFWNTAISAFGAFISVIGILFLILRVDATKSPIIVLAFAIYGFGLVNMFVSSALHHGIDGSAKTNHMLRQYDYYAISLMIAGTFTPLCVILLRSTFGWTILALMWTFAALGIALKAIFPKVPRWLTTALFIGMGWMGLIILKPLYLALHWDGFALLLLGGLFYTIGGLIFVLEKPNPIPGKFGFHEIWHCFVLAGAASHFFVMEFYL